MNIAHIDQEKNIQSCKQHSEGAAKIAVEKISSIG